MSRGKWKTTLLKEHIQIAQIEAEAIRLAALNIEQKMHEKKSFFDSLREHIGKMIDRIDVLDVAAIGALTVILQPSILSVSQFGDWIGLTQPVPFIDFSHGIQGIFWYDPEKTPMTKTKEQTAYVMSWLVAFVVADVLIKHGAEVIKAFGDIGKFAAFLLLK